MPRRKDDADDFQFDPDELEGLPEEDDFELEEWLDEFPELDYLDELDTLDDDDFYEPGK